MVSIISSGTDEVRAKKEPSLCNESVIWLFWSNLCLNCIFKWTWFVKTDIWSVIDGSRVRFPIFLSFLTRFPFCSTRISKVGKCAAFQLWTPTYFFENWKLLHTCHLLFQLQWVLGRYRRLIKWILVVTIQIFYRAKSNTNLTIWLVQQSF